jgi:hypothetical protein
LVRQAWEEKALPFTLAHPAIVVPLAWRRSRCIILSALVVGSMSPDFEYFFWLQTKRTIGHELVGIPLMCVPAGLAVLWLFHRFIKQELIDLCPRGIRLRLEPLRAPLAFTPLGRFVAILFCLAIGAITHIVWDDFTHAHGWFATHTALSQTPLFRLGDRTVRLYNALQYGCSIVGLTLLAWWTYAWLRHQPELGPLITTAPKAALQEWARPVFLLAVAASAALVYGLFFVQGGREYRLNCGLLFGISTAFVGLTVMGMLTELRARRS